MRTKLFNLTLQDTEMLGSKHMITSLSSVAAFNSPWKGIYLSSSGGSDGGNFAEVIKLSRQQEHTFVGGDKLHSLALTFFLCGKHRMVFPRTDLLLHEPRVQIGMKTYGQAKSELEILKLTYESTKEPYVLQEIKYMKQLVRGLAEARINTARWFSNRTKLRTETALKLMQEETYFSAKEAVAIGIADKIISPTLIVIS